MASLWSFSKSVPEERRQRLTAIQSFDEVIARLIQGSVVNFAVEPRQNPPCVGCSRAIFKLEVRTDDYDAFFNSPVGYRAQYCIDSSHGISENRRLVDALIPSCLDFAHGREPTHFPAKLVSASLRGVDAKIWINEEDLPDVDEIHVDYPPWVAKVRAASSGTLADQAARASAFAGVLAPVGTNLELKGAWVESGGNECRDPAKANRGAEIRDYGFT